MVWTEYNAATMYNAQQKSYKNSLRYMYNEEIGTWWGVGPDFAESLQQGRCSANVQRDYKELVQPLYTQKWQTEVHMYIQFIQQHLQSF